MAAGYVYVLKTIAFTAIKIGSTTKTPEERAAELSGTGTPHPFRVVHRAWVDDCRDIERQVHEHFTEQRWAKNREFFLVSVAIAAAAIDELAKKSIYKPQEHFVHETIDENLLLKMKTEYPLICQGIDLYSTNGPANFKNLTAFHETRPRYLRTVENTIKALDAADYIYCGHGCIDSTRGVQIPMFAPDADDCRTICIGIEDRQPEEDRIYGCSLT